MTVLRPNQSTWTHRTNRHVDDRRGRRRLRRVRSSRAETGPIRGARSQPDLAVDPRSHRSRQRGSDHRRWLAKAHARSLGKPRLHRRCPATKASPVEPLAKASGPGPHGAVTRRQRTTVAERTWKPAPERAADSASSSSPKGLLETLVGAAACRCRKRDRGAFGLAIVAGFGVEARRSSRSGRGGGLVASSVRRRGGIR